MEVEGAQTATSLEVTRALADGLQAMIKPHDSSDRARWPLLEGRITRQFTWSDRRCGASGEPSGFPSAIREGDHGVWEPVSA
jgi:hypothetical protein